MLCGSVTGDDNDFDLNTSKFSIIVTTPEKFDSLSRKWNACDYMRAIKLLMIDEVIVFSILFFENHSKNLHYNDISSPELIVCMTWTMVHHVL